MTQAEMVLDFPHHVRVPESETQAGQILRYLKNGGTLTPLEALQLFGCFSLSQRCGELKRAGWPIYSSMVKVGEGKRVAKYWMAEAA